MLKIKSVSEHYPVWELSGFNTPNLDISFPEKREKEAPLPINKKRIPVPLPEEATDFCREWKRATSQIVKYLQSDKCFKDCPEVRGMWPNGFSRLSWDEPHKCVSIIKDSAGFFMHPHIDNREVIAVLIVNLHDNPEGTGTKFVNNPYEKHTYENYKENLWYEGPTKKGTGLFFLNNWNTWHRIENDTGKTRYIAYETLHVSQMLRR